MNKHFLVLSTALSLLQVGILLSTTAAHAQSGGKKPAPAKPKTVVQKPAKPTGPVVLGTTQLPGDFGKLGTTYTIGKSHPINFTLKSAEYSIEPLTIGQNTWVPRATEKRLVLHYTVHNPMPTEHRYYWADIQFTAVDAKDTNHQFIQAVTREGEREPLSIDLKPAQKIDVTASIIVPAEGVVPKLIVERERSAPVIRYDLRDKVTPLAAGFADPADTTGATALKEVAAQAGTFYPMGDFDTRLDEVAYVNGPLIKREPGEGKRYLTAIFTIKNRTNSPKRYAWSDFLPDLRDADGEKSPNPQAILKASRDESTYGDLAAGEEARIRFFFPLPTNVAGKTLRLAEGKEIDARTARVYAFDLTAATGTAPN
jgi:hypothetical protein